MTAPPTFVTRLATHARSERLALDLAHGQHEKAAILKRLPLFTVASEGKAGMNAASARVRRPVVLRRAA